MSAAQPRLATGRVHYAWIVVAVTFVVVVVTAGVRAAPGVLIVPLENEFHWSRATISLAAGVNLMCYGLIGPFAAVAMDRFGVRRTMSLALAATAVAVALSPTMHETWQLILLWGVAVGLSTGFIGAYLAAFIAARWFRVREGLVVGILTAANAAGQLIFLPTMAAIVTTTGLIGTHLIPACIDHGITEVAGAGLLAATGVFALIGGTLSGWLSDRWDNRFLLFWYYGLRGLALMYLPFALDLSFYGLSFFSVFYGLDWIASAPPTVRLLSRVVGAERTGIMVAWITALHMVGGAAAAYLAGVLRISYGSYLEAFMIAGLLCIGAALAVLFIGAGRKGLEPVVVAPAAA